MCNLSVRVLRWIHSVALSTVAVGALAADVASRGPALENTGPWGIASGAEWSGDYPTFNPLLRDAGVRWLRYFPEWQTVQPNQGEWNWSPSDRLVANARTNGIQVVGVFAYFAKWASADGGTRKGPIKDVQFWREYVATTVARYRNDIQHWEVWNEFNGSFYQGPNKPKEYAELTVAAYDEAKKVDPKLRIGISVANFDVGFLDATIKAGAAGHFDFVCVHPYENLGAAMAGGEPGYLSLANSLRRMLAANGQPADLPLWITETGYQAPIAPDGAADLKQAEALAKVYVLSMAQGFERVCWFEARGPAYGKGTDHGIIRKDWTPRPAYVALKTMTSLLGEAPAYLGWVQMGKTGYGFVFEGRRGSVLVAWMPPDTTEEVRFQGNVQVFELSGAARDLATGDALALTRVPVLVTQLPRAFDEQARANAKRPFPWGTDFGSAKQVSCRLGAINQEQGIQQTRLETTAVVNGLVESSRRSNFAYGSEGRYAYFRVDPSFAGFGNNELQITVVARRMAADKDASLSLCYESLKGYRNAQGRFALPAGNEWVEHTWTVNDANFVGGWGWNFRTDATGSPGECDFREVRVTRAVAAP